MGEACDGRTKEQVTYWSKLSRIRCDLVQQIELLEETGEIGEPLMIM